MPKIICSHQVRDNTGFKRNSEDQGHVEDEENDYIAESESMLHSYCSRENYSSQTSFRQVDSGQPLNDECPVSEESTSTNPKLLQCLLNQMQSYPRLWDKACREKIHAQKKRLTYINIESILGIDGKSIRKLVIRWPKSILRVASFRVFQLVIVNYEVLPREKDGKRERGVRGGRQGTLSLLPENIREPYGFLMFSEGRERVHWEQMGQV